MLGNRDKTIHRMLLWLKDIRKWNFCCAFMKGTTFCGWVNTLVLRTSMKAWVDYVAMCLCQRNISTTKASTSIISLMLGPHHHCNQFTPWPICCLTKFATWGQSHSISLHFAAWVYKICSMMTFLHLSIDVGSPLIDANLLYITTWVRFAAWGQICWMVTFLHWLGTQPPYNINHHVK